MNKSKACEALFKELHNVYNENSSTYRREGKEFTIIILIPEGIILISFQLYFGLVSLLIGRKG